MDSGDRHEQRRRNRDQRRLERVPAANGSEAPRPPRLRKLRFAFVLLGLGALAFVSWIFGIMMAVAQDLPSLENRAQYERAQNSVVVDRYGEKLATLTNNEGRILLDSPDIAATMKDAVVAVEDTRFYEHRGVDYQGIARAVYQDLLAGSTEQGASTITQQFVKNALAAQQDRTIFQKLREAALAYHLERQWSKDKILTEYLNSIYFGEGAYGIESAARTYFGSEHPGCGQGEDATTCASQLLPWEAALLAGIISSPSAYSPRANPAAAEARRNLVLQKMMEEGYITEEEYGLFSSYKIPGEDDIQPPTENSEAPYFTSWLRQQLVNYYGAGEAFGGGLEVTSTLDLELQQQIEGIVSSTLGGIAPTGSVVVLDNANAGVLAMVGGFDFDKSPFNLATNGHRQPGSAFKPFTLVTALSEGRSSSEVFASSPQEIPFRTKVEKKNGKTEVVNEIFAPENYEGSYLGSASIATGTTYSDNSVYAQLGMQVGPADVAETANEMGIETDLSTDVLYSVNDGPFEPYNPALILGGLGVGVSPLEMAHAYNTLQKGGARISGTLAASKGGVVGIEKVLDEEDQPVETNEGDEGVNRVTTDQVIDPEVAAEAKSILATVVSSGTGRRAATGEETWGKTGTTDDNGDAWFCGATPEITACVWVGYPDTVTPMLTEFAGGPVDGGTFPALIFAQVVNAFESLQSARKTGEDIPDAPEGTVGPTELAPEPSSTELVPESDGGGGAPPAAGGGDAGGGGAAPAASPSGGGISAG